MTASANVRTPTAKHFCSLVRPNTLLTCHRRLAAQKYDSGRVRIPGRPRAKEEIEESIVKLGRENRSCGGYTRIQGALANLRHAASRGTIANVLRSAGMEPVPVRRQGMTWKEFLKTYRDVLAATGFFTVEVWTGRDCSASSYCL